MGPLTRSQPSGPVGTTASLAYEIVQLHPDRWQDEQTDFTLDKL